VINRDQKQLNRSFVMSSEVETSLTVLKEDIRSTRQIWTIGHSMRKIDQFTSLLEENGIKLVVDVRSLPGSKRNPQFNKEALAQSLRERGIGYEHLPDLGGRRKPKPDSRNTAWRNASFRGYADYMETEQFRKGVNDLSILQTISAQQRSCARKRSGGAAIGR